MAMYYQGGQENQADGLQTLYLMNPNYATAYSDTRQTQQLPSANMLMLNYAAAGNQLNVPTMPSGNVQHHLVGVPLGSGNPKFSHRQLLEHQHEVSGSRTGTPYFHQGLWGSVEQTSGCGSGGGGIQPHIPTGVVGGGGGAEVGFQRPAVVAPTQQGLSLSLSSQQPGYGSLPMDHNNISMIISPTSGGSSCSFSGVSNGLFSVGQSVVLGSKYLKAAQQLLDELVNVGKVIKAENNIMEKGKEKEKTDNKDSNMGLSGEEASIEMKGGDQLTTPQKQDIQMKKAKLMSVLDEVEQRYRQYHHQMQIVVASFEQATGIGSARSYTHLALQTISKQFRCLKDAISAQIKAASKSLGEDQEGLVGGKVEGSRLKFVDQQLRQQRALQHLGMIQNNAWRPQRGLPERAVSVLRAWLFEHFLHPYPKDSDKQMLAKQTGLTRSQVSNWFINARVRLWKPMVEEMYAEEMKNQEEDGRESNKEIGSKSITPKGKNAVQTDQLINTLNSQQEKSIMQDEISNSSVTLSPSGNSPQARGGFGLVCALKVDGKVGKNTKQLRTDMQNSPSSILSMDMEMKFGDTRKGFINTNKFSSLVANNTSDGNGFGAFTIGELGQFNSEQLTTGFHGNGVSLTLGLPPSENHLPLSGSQPNFLSEQSMDLGMAEAHYDRVNKPQASSHASIGYETIDFESRKRFAEPFLPDFVS